MDVVVAGVDEVGRGCLAGPVYSAPVILDPKKLVKLDPKKRRLIRDSKTLSRDQREFIAPVIQEIAMSYAVGSANVEEIETIGILPATFLSMRKALEQLSVKPTLVQVDGKLKIPGLPIDQETIIKGDSKSPNIAAASILAKVARDQQMREFAEIYPGYGFAKNVGYGTKEHLDGLHELGYCHIHRKTFAPIRDMLT